MGEDTISIGTSNLVYFHESCQGKVNEAKQCLTPLANMGRHNPTTRELLRNISKISEVKV